MVVHDGDPEWTGKSQPAGVKMKFRISLFQKLFNPKRPIVSRIASLCCLILDLPILGSLESYLIPLGVILLPALLIFFVGVFNPDAIPKASAMAWYLLASLILSVIGWFDWIFVGGIRVSW